MAILCAQATGNVAGAGATHDATYSGNVTDGNLVVITIDKYANVRSDPVLAVDLAVKVGSTATLGAISVDSQSTEITLGDNSTLQTTILSAEVTGTGSLTLTLTHGNSNDSSLIGIAEFSGTDVSGTRVEDSDVGTGASGAPATAAMTSAGAAVFVGACLTDSTSTTAHTAGADYTLIFENEDYNYATGNFCYRIVSGGTTDAVDWTAPTTFTWKAAGAVYKAAAAGGVTVTQTSVISATASVLTHSTSILYPGSITTTITL